MPVHADDPDALLLRCYVSDGSEAAFRVLAERWLPLVWSTARRVLNGDNTLAEDVAQQVLADFAKQAHKLPPGMPAGGWLHRHTIFTASKTVRGERRRRDREQAAAAHTTMITDPAETWRDALPHLDAALDRLPAADRAALLLRFYEGRGLRDVGQSLGISEEAARKRIDRALEKLRLRLARASPLLTLALLSGFLRQEAAAAAPALVSQRLIAGAWRAVKSAPAAAAGLPWWRGRAAKSTAAAVMTGAFVWFLWSLMAPAQAERGGGASIVRAATSAAAKTGEFGHGPPRKLTATLITLSEEPFTLRMLSFTPDSDDTALYRELLPQAEVAQKRIKPDKAFATAGHPLVVLSSELRPRPLPAPPQPTPAPADPFAAADPFADTGSTDPFASYDWASPPECAKAEALYPWQTEFDPNPANGHIIAADLQAALEHGAVQQTGLGTALSATLSPAETGGQHTAWCKVTHHLAPPGEVNFNPWPASENVPGEADLTQPMFYTTELECVIPLRPGGGPVLAAMQTIGADELPAADATPRRVFLFLTLEP